MKGKNNLVNFPITQKSLGGGGLDFDEVGAWSQLPINFVMSSSTQVKKGEGKGRKGGVRGDWVGHRECGGGEGRKGVSSK